MKSVVSFFLIISLLSAATPKDKRTPPPDSLPVFKQEIGLLSEQTRDSPRSSFWLNILAVGSRQTRLL